MRLEPNAAQTAGAHGTAYFPDTGYSSAGTLNDLTSALLGFQSLLIQPFDGDMSVMQGAQHLSQALKRAELQLAAFQAAIEAMNDLPPPSDARDKAIGLFLLPFSIKGLSAKNLHESSEKNLLDAYERTHLNSKTGQVEIQHASFAVALAPFLSSEAANGQLPPPEKYIALSIDDVLRRKCSSFLADRENTQGELDQLMKTVEGRKVHPKFEDPLAGPIAKAQSNVRAAQGKIQKLFDENLRDVNPERVPECLSGVSARITAHPAVISRMLSLHNGLEAAISALCVRREDPAPVDISLPFFSTSGSLTEATCRIPADAVPRSQQDVALLANLVQLYATNRSVLVSIYNNWALFESLRGFQPSLERALGAPFASHEDKGALVYERLLGHSDVGLSQALFHLFGQSFIAPVSQQSQLPLVENSGIVGPVVWLVRKYLLDDAEESANGGNILRTSIAMQRYFLPFLDRVHAVLRNDNPMEVIRAITERIDKTQKSDNFFEAIGPLLVLGALVQDGNLSDKLKNQIPNLDTLMQRVKESEHQRLAARVVARLSATLSDYYREAEMRELWGYLERFSAFMDEPQCVHGLAGNEAMSGGILLKGVPGVGKSYLVECIARDYGLKAFSTSPDADISGSGDELLFHAAKDAFSKAIHHATVDKAPCILFIDEAETMVPDRKSPKTSLPEASLTGYILREINEIRRKYPEILVIIASNYPEDLDPALLRIGRIDIQVEMEPPGDLLRAHIIADTLQKTPQSLSISETEMQELIEVTKGFIPLQIVQCINELTRIDPVVARKRGETCIVDFQALKEKFLRESERRNLYQTEIELRKQGKAVMIAV